MKHFSVLCALIGAAWILTPAATAADGDRNPYGCVMAGVWQGKIYLGQIGGQTLVLDATSNFHPDGTTDQSISEVTGGFPGLQGVTSPFRGVWKRTGPCEVGAVLLNYRYGTDPAPFLLIGKIESQITLVPGHSQLKGQFRFGHFVCTPNPTTGWFDCPDLETLVKDWPTPMTPWVPFEAKRLKITSPTTP